MGNYTIFDIFSFLFTWAWRFMTCFYIPGTNLTPASIALFVSFSGIVLKFLTQLFGVGSVSGSNAIHAQRTRVGRSSKDKS